MLSILLLINWCYSVAWASFIYNILNHSHTLTCICIKFFLRLICRIINSFVLWTICSEAPVTLRLGEILVRIIWDLICWFLWTKPDLWSGDVTCGVSPCRTNAALRKVELQFECHWGDWLQLIWGRSKFSLYGFVLSHQFWSDRLTCHFCVLHTVWDLKTVRSLHQSRQRVESNVSIFRCH